LVSAGVVVADIVLTALAFGVMFGFLSVSGGMLAAMKWVGVVALLLFAINGLRCASFSVESTSKHGSSPAHDFCAGAAVVLASPFTMIFLLALLPQFVPSSGSDVRPALIAAGVFVAGSAAAQAGGVLFGAYSLRIGGLRTRWVENAGAVLLMGFAGAAVFTPVG
jgi:threonine/homoserine/homoserine lactone efflux protein